MKGYYSNGDYWGLIDGKYMRFENEGAYEEYYKERSAENG